MLAHPEIRNSHQMEKGKLLKKFTKGKMNINVTCNNMLQCLSIAYLRVCSTIIRGRSHDQILPSPRATQLPTQAYVWICMVHAVRPHGESVPWDY